MDKRECKVNGINVHYRRTGGNKPAVVLLHGLMTSGACWAPLARELEADYDVVMPDARGHGYSSAPNQGYFYDHLATDVFCFMEALGLESPVLLGHSMGGMTAAFVASRYSERLRGLALVDPTFLTPQRQREVYESDVAVQHRQTLSRSKEELLANLRARHRHRSKELIELFADARFQTSIHAFEVLTPPNPDYLQLIKIINIPTLLITGGAGAIVSPEVATELAGLNQKLEVVQIPNAGHGIPFDQPNQFSCAVKRFLSSIRYT